ncbi:MAG: ribosome-associated translation inhibitor RaiA [Phycisphaerae bacterium]|nr:ribosome-associated translation inhibitor RaiA [Phycisphaerae bacterium]
MNVLVSSRHMELTPPIKTYAEQKANKLGKYYDRIRDIEVIFDADGGAKGEAKDHTIVEMIVNAEHHLTFVARHEGEAYGCVDTCVHKLERQLTEHKKLFRNRKHPGEDTPKTTGA